MLVLLSLLIYVMLAADNCTFFQHPHYQTDEIEINVGKESCKDPDPDRPGLLQQSLDFLMIC